MAFFIVYDGSGSLDLEQLVAFRRGGMSFNDGADRTFPNLTDLQGSSITSVAGSVTLPVITELNGVSLIAEMAATITAPMATSYDTSDAFSWGRLRASDGRGQSDRVA